MNSNCAQPHIWVRFISTSSYKDILPARRICMLWMIFCLIGAVALGFFGIAYFAKNPDAAGLWRQIRKMCSCHWYNCCLVRGLLVWCVCLKLLIKKSKAIRQNNTLHTEEWRESWSCPVLFDAFIRIIPAFAGIVLSTSGYAKSVSVYTDLKRRFNEFCAALYADEICDNLITFL